MIAARVLTGVEIENEDFRTQDLSHQDMSHSRFRRCNFDDANMSFVNGEGTSFIGSSFRRTNCYRFNAKDAELGATIFEPSDCYGMTVTLQCKTFTEMNVSKQWWYCWLILLTLMRPILRIGEDEIRDMLIAHIGAERYVRLRDKFRQRDL